MAEKYSKLTLIWAITSIFFYFTGFIALAYSAKAIKAGGEDNKQRKRGATIAKVVLIFYPIFGLVSCMNAITNFQIPG